MINNTHPNIPSHGFLRIRNIIGDPKAVPPIPAILPISKSKWWKGVKSGEYPAPVALGPRTTAWRANDILELVKKLNA